MQKVESEVSQVLMRQIMDKAYDLEGLRGVIVSAGMSKRELESALMGIHGSRVWSLAEDKAGLRRMLVDAVRVPTIMYGMEGHYERGRWVENVGDNTRKWIFEPGPRLGKVGG